MKGPQFSIVCCVEPSQRKVGSSDWLPKLLPQYFNPLSMAGSVLAKVMSRN